MHVYVLPQATIENLEHDLPKSYKFEGTVGWIWMLLKSWLEPEHPGLKCTILWDSVGQAPCRRPIRNCMIKGNKGNRKNSWLTACPNIPLPWSSWKVCHLFLSFQKAWLCHFCGCRSSVQQTVYHNSSQVYGIVFTCLAISVKHNLSLEFTLSD